MKIYSGSICVVVLFALFGKGFANPDPDPFLPGLDSLGGILGGAGGGGGGLPLLGSLLGGGGAGGGSLGSLSSLLGSGGPLQILTQLLGTVTGLLNQVVETILGPAGILGNLFGSNGVLKSLNNGALNILLGPTGIIAKVLVDTGLDMTVAQILQMLNEAGVFDFLETLDGVIDALGILKLNCHNKTESNCTGLAICLNISILNLNKTLHVCNTSLVISLLPIECKPSNCYAEDKIP